MIRVLGLLFASIAPGAVEDERWHQTSIADIITPEEAAEFEKLPGQEARAAFIEEFWLRRDPTPDTEENEFRDQHYQRVAYAIANFGAPNREGWNTPAGRVYVVFGPPDRVEQHTGHEMWLYRWMEGVGTDIAIDFASGRYCPVERNLVVQSTRFLIDMGYAMDSNLAAGVEGIELNPDIARFTRLQEWVSRLDTNRGAESGPAPSQAFKPGARDFGFEAVFSGVKDWEPGETDPVADFAIVSAETGSMVSYSRATIGGDWPLVRVTKPLPELPPGSYIVRIKLTESARFQAATAEARYICPQGVAGAKAAAN